MCSDKQTTQRSDKGAVLDAAENNSDHLSAFEPELKVIHAPSQELLARARVGWRRFVDSLEDCPDE